MVNELTHADVHYIIAKGLAQSGQQYSKEFIFSPVFWRFTYQAHIESVFYYLCKIYDQHDSAFHLRRLLEIVKQNIALFEADNFARRLGKNAEEEIKFYKSIDQHQLQDDYDFVSKKNPLVDKLKRWRDNVFAHRNPKQILSQKPFETNHPFPFSEIEFLINRGSEIINRYSGYFSSTHYSTKLNGSDDFSYVLESLEHHPRSVERKRWDEYYKKAE